MAISNRKLESARYAVSVLQELLESQAPDPARLILSYMDAKRQLANAFQEIASDFYDDSAPWEQFLEWAETYPNGLLPGASRAVSTLGPIHRVFFSYLWQQGRRGADTDMLRLLSGDAVHTERRLRELREAGLQIQVARRGSGSVYVLNRAGLPWEPQHPALHELE